MRLFSLMLALCGTMLAASTTPIPQDAKPELLVVSERTGNAEVFLINADGSEPKNLTLSNCFNSFPCWSPDGQTIAFVSDFDGCMNIYTMNASGNNTKQLTKSKKPTLHPSWSPDGKQIVFSRNIKGGPHVFIMDADGENEKLIMAKAADPTWSPDGKKILFASDRSGVGVRVYVMDVDGANVIELTFNTNKRGHTFPAWSPDGKKIAWADLAGEDLEIFVADADGRNAKQLTMLGGINTYAAWSPDGKKLAFHHSEANQAGALYVMDADGGNQRVLLNNETKIRGGYPAWRPK